MYKYKAYRIVNNWVAKNGLPEIDLVIHVENDLEEMTKWTFWELIQIVYGRTSNR